MSSLPLVHLSAEEVRRALPMPEAIAAMREAFLDLSAGRAGGPRRVHLSLPEPGAVQLLMPGVGREGLRTSLKSVCVVPGNPARGLPMIQSLVILTDGLTGTPLAVVDGAALTAIRTGAASGVATDLLARRNARVVAILGAGPQARTQLEAVCAVREIREARVAARTAASAARFGEEMSARLGVPVRACGTCGEAVRDADIVCTVTTSRTPILRDEDLAPGAHINAVGVFKPDEAEIPPETVVRARLFVDHGPAALEEAGDLLGPLREGLISLERLGVELGHVLAGEATGRGSESELSLFKSVGVAVQDLYAATRAVEKAVRLGLGRELPR